MTEWSIEPAPSERVILIVDNDLGFVFWAGWSLHKAGYSILPASTVSSAKKLVDQFQLVPSLLIINMSLRGASGLAKSIRQACPGARVLAIANQPQETAFEQPAESIIARPRDPDDPQTAATLVRTVKLLLPRHYGHIQGL